MNKTTNLKGGSPNRRTRNEKVDPQSGGKFPSVSVDKKNVVIVNPPVNAQNFNDKESKNEEYNSDGASSGNRSGNRGDVKREVKKPKQSIGGVL